MKELGMINRILLGLVMLVPGLLKLFVMGPSAVSGMMSGIVLFSWAPMFWAWILIIAEILFGIAILAKFKTDYASYGAAIIIFIATVFIHIKWAALGTTSWSSVLIHLVVVSNYLLLGCHGCKKKK